jgi:chitosanase
MLTTIQKKTAKAIVNIFETGFVLSDFDNVTLIPGNPGHLTFGRSQTTLGSGNLFKLVKLYCGSSIPRFGSSMKAFLPRFAKIDLSLDHEKRKKLSGKT